MYRTPSYPNHSLNSRPLQYRDFSLYQRSYILYRLILATHGGGYKSKIFSRLRSLIVPLLIFNAAGLIISQSYYHINPWASNPLEGLSLSTLPEWLYGSKFNKALWYLRALFEFVLIAPVFGWLIRISKYSILLVIPLYLFGMQFSYFMLFYWSVCIYTGAYIAIYFDGIKRVYNKLSGYTKWTISAMALITLAVLLALADYYTLRIFTPLCLLAFLAPIPLHRCRSLLLLAPYSFLIYCLHFPLWPIMTQIPAMAGVNSNMIAFVLTIILSVLLILITGKILRHYPRIWNILNGGRKRSTPIKVQPAI